MARGNTKIAAKRKLPLQQPVKMKTGVSKVLEPTPVAITEPLIVPPAVRKKTLLMVAHNHPQFFPGGAEIVAYDLFKHFRDKGEYDAYFLGGLAPGERAVHCGAGLQAANDAPNEFLFWGQEFDYFLQSQLIQPFLHHDFRELLQNLKPDVIHFHHTMRIGLEALEIARQELPNVNIIYTLHEYILMCHRDGQMVRKGSEELCTKATPALCHRCFPEVSAARFKMREAFIKAHLSHVDQFLSPSNFLAQRFVNWGLPQEKIKVLENGREVIAPMPARALSKGQKRNVFGYFGQVNPYKGVLLLLDAAAWLVKEGVTDFRIEIHGSLLHQTEAFQQSFHEALNQCRDQVRFHGRYDAKDFLGHIAAVDWVVVPSVWWENSPLVIQEALMHQRPVICSDIGGMAEKVEHGVTGLHFRARNAESLAACLKQAMTGETLIWEQMRKQIAPRLSTEDFALKHEEIYSVKRA